MQKLKKKQIVKKKLHFDKFQNPSGRKIVAGSGEKSTCGSPKLTVSLGSDCSF